MLRSSNVLKSTIGTKINGFAFELDTEKFNSLSISIWISFPQWAHSV